jgi:hypothetical protein
MGAYERRSGTPVTVPSDGITTATATVSCTLGKKVLGGGFTLTGYLVYNHSVTTSANRATADDTWSVTVGDLYGGGGLTVTAYAVCM